jgi:hypothetical protein
MSVSEYCGRLKRLADTLYDCGAAVSDLALVINTLRGLNNKFNQAITVLSTMTPPPMFLYTRSYLVQEENRIRHPSRWKRRRRSWRWVLPLHRRSRRLPTLPNNRLPLVAAVVIATRSARHSTTTVAVHLRPAAILPRPAPISRCLLLDRSGRPPTTLGKGSFRRGRCTHGAPAFLALVLEFNRLRR